MNVALYHPWIYLKGGAERVILNLIERSRHDWTVLTNHFDPNDTFPEFARHRVIELGRISVRRNPLIAGHAALTLLFQRIPVQSFDALMVSQESIGNMVTIRAGNIPLICYCHTPLRVAYDPVIRPLFEAKASVIAKLAVSAFTEVDRKLWKRYRRVFVNSLEVQQRLLRSQLVDASKITLARPGVEVWEPFKEAPSESFFLVAGRIMWTKNIELAIDAFAHLKRTEPAAAPFRLVIAGAVDRKSLPYLDALQSQAARLGQAVTFLNGPSDWELRQLYHNSYAVLFTAHNEDWGLVPLEAMAAGKPVLAVDRGGPRESVIHEQTGLLGPPEAEAMAGLMSRVVRNPEYCALLGRQAIAHVRSFSWDNMVEPIDSFLDTLSPKDRCGSGSTAAS